MFSLKPRSAVVRYGVAVGCIVIGWLVRESLIPVIGPTALPFVFFIPAVTISAWYGGWGPGLLAMFLGVATSNWFFIEPVHTLKFGTMRSVLALPAFLVSSSFIIFSMEAMHRANARTRAELRARIEADAELARLKDKFATTLASIGGVAAETAETESRGLLSRQDTRGAKSAARPIARMFIAAAILLIGSMIVVYRAGSIQVASQAKMSRRLLVLNQSADDFLSSMKDAETGERGYLLTGEESYLDPYIHGRAMAQTQLDALQDRVESGQLPKERMERIRTLTQQILSGFEQTIQLRRERGMDAALAVVHENRGKQAMDDLRAEIARTRNVEEHEFAAASRRAEWAANVRTVTFLSACLLNLAFLKWAFYIVSREVRRRESAVFETGKQKELLGTTLASIGDAVIATDADGRVLFLNPEAEKLTGWKSSEGAGRPLAEVFRIVNEQTREPMESPVEKVLGCNSAIGVTNRAVLLARDGREIPIDDSAAPIRHPGGPLAGVVLVFRDFTEQREAQRVLARSKEELEVLVKVRTAKLQEMINELQHVSYAMVHDMRAPLRAMDAFASLLAEGAAEGIPPEQTQEYTRRIIVAAGRLDRLIQDGLNYTKVAQQEMLLGPVNLSELVRDLIDTYPNLHSDKADIYVDDGLPVVLGNDSLLTQCFSNLLGNAVKFVRPGVRPEIHVRAENLDHMVRVWIKDNGIGIPKNAQARLFQMFQKLDTQYEGTGIGLAIVRKVVERMGGRVGVESEPGVGSSFWVELPIVRDGNNKRTADE